MKHYGDITKLSGWDLPIVDCIIGGSPCQDLSLAGARKGLSGERSGLFMHQVRIMKEMRERDRLENGRSGFLCRPRFLGWENVPGTFSSNAGKDYQAVLTEIVRVAEPNAPDVPMPEGGRWPKAGCLYDELGRWSVAWRVHDAQYWNLAQRRVRLSVVLDAGGLSAPEVLFERKGMSWYPQPGEETGKETPGDSGGGAYPTIANTLTERYDGSPDPSKGHGANIVCYGISGYDSNAMKSPNPNSGVYEAETARSLDNNGGSPVCNQGGMMIVQTVFENHMQDARHKPMGEVCETVASTYKGPGNTQDGACVFVPDKSHALHAKANCQYREDSETYLQDKVQMVVRRLTPLECERLQGFPDGWTDIGDWVDTKGRKHRAADSPRYKALGNSIAVGYANGRCGFWMRMVKRISAQYDRAATLGSLFDGIGGFPLAWESINGKGTAVWASEIEEFCIAVTKKYFPEEEN